MQCIWTGDITKKDDILKFRAILENTSTWGTRIFRPLMAKFINQWQIMYNRACAKAAMIHQQERIELSRGVLQLVNRVLSSQPHREGCESSHEVIKKNLINLCDSFIRDVDRVIEDKVQSPENFATTAQALSPPVRGCMFATMASTKAYCPVPKGPIMLTSRVRALEDPSLPML